MRIVSQNEVDVGEQTLERDKESLQGVWQCVRKLAGKVRYQGLGAALVGLDAVVVVAVSSGLGCSDPLQTAGFRSPGTIFTVFLRIRE